MLEPNLQLLLHAVVKLMLLAEFVSQGLRGVALIDDDLLDAVLRDVDFDVQLGVARLLVRICLDWFFKFLLLILILLGLHRCWHILIVLFVPLLVLRHFARAAQVVDLRIECRSGSVGGKGLPAHIFGRSRDFVGTHLSRPEVGLVRFSGCFLVRSLGAFSGRIVVAPGHETLEILFLSSLLLLVDMLVECVLCHGRLFGRVPYRLSRIDSRLEGAMLLVLLVFDVRGTSIHLLTRHFRLQVKIKIRIASRRHASVSQILLENLYISLRVVSQFFFCFLFQLSFDLCHVPIRSLLVHWRG